MSAIVLSGLSRSFGAVHAVRELTFEVQEGELFGFMGHNGAGKTTTLRMLLGLTQPTGGSASVLGHDVVTDTLEVRRLCGFLPASYALPAEQTARGFLHYVAAMFGLRSQEARERVESLLERFELTPVADRKLRGFSTGMTQKVGLAQALINRPRVLLLDEPTAGLDPLGRHALLEMLRDLSKNDGVTVLFSSHILSDIQSLCRRVVVMHHGQRVAFGDLAQLQREQGVSDTDALYLSLARKAMA